jgi:hypothetical protein
MIFLWQISLFAPGKFWNGTCREATNTTSTSFPFQRPIKNHLTIRNCFNGVGKPASLNELKINTRYSSCKKKTPLNKLKQSEDRAVIKATADFKNIQLLLGEAGFAYV